jgi:hypothetical protein
VSRRYEWLEPGAEVISDPEEIADMFDEWEPVPGDEVVLVMGNPWATAAVLQNTPDGIIETLREWIELVEASRPPVVVDATTNRRELMGTNSTTTSAADETVTLDMLAEQLGTDAETAAGFAGHINWRFGETRITQQEADEIGEIWTKSLADREAEQA